MSEIRGGGIIKTCSSSNQNDNPLCSAHPSPLLSPLLPCGNRSERPSPPIKIPLSIPPLGERDSGESLSTIGETFPLVKVHILQPQLVESPSSVPSGPFSRSSVRLRNTREKCCLQRSVKAAHVIRYVQVTSRVHLVYCMCCITVSFRNDAFCCLLGLAVFSHLLLHCAQMDVFVTLSSPRIASNKQ